MTPQLVLRYPGLPASSNRLYIRGHILTNEARTFKSEFKGWMVRHHAMDIQRFLEQHSMESAYAMRIVVRIATLENKAWHNPKLRNHKDPEKRPRTRYKRIDLDNRLKLLQDCVRDSIGLAFDDSQIFQLDATKVQGTPESVEVHLYPIDPKQYGML
jgi:Holliday junction resolvase RusA-like endonuclease